MRRLRRERRGGWGLVGKRTQRPGAPGRAMAREKARAHVAQRITRWSAGPAPAAGDERGGEGRPPAHVGTAPGARVRACSARVRRPDSRDRRVTSIEGAREPAGHEPDAGRRATGWYWSNNQKHGSAVGRSDGGVRVACDWTQCRHAGTMGGVHKARVLAHRLAFRAREHAGARCTPRLPLARQIRAHIDPKIRRLASLRA